MRTRRLMVLCLLLGGFQAFMIQPGAARQQLDQPAPAAMPPAHDSLWIAGSSFKPWASSTPYTYYTNGCIVSGSGGSPSTPSFTASLSVPDQSTVLGLEFFFYDTSDSNSHIKLTSYNGATTGIEHVTVSSKGNSGYGSSVVALSTPYTTNEYGRSLVINWFPTVAGESMRLCGARLIYDIGSATGGPLSFDYLFQSGLAFKRLDSTVQYGSTAVGCMYSTSSGMLMLDLDIPNGSTVQGIYFLYFQISPVNLSFYLYDFDGLGASRLLAAASSSGSSMSNPYGEIFSAITIAGGSYVVDQSTRSLNVLVTGATGPTQICGVRVRYTPPPPHSSALPSVETAAPTGPPAASEHPATEAALRPTDIGDDFTADLQLPQGVSTEGMRLYYLNSQRPDGWVDTWNYNGTTASFLGSTFSNTYTGYGSRYQTFSAPYTVNRAEAGLGLVAWIPPSKYYRFCGVRVRYIEDGQPQFRFLAGTAFHPRNSSSAYRHLGAGCIGVTRQFVFLPMLSK